MSTLIHLCKKDFTYAKPWLIGTWLALLAGSLLPWLSPAGEAALPFMLIAKLAPVLLIFFTTVKLVQADPLIGSNSFMGTRPVTRTRLLGGKLLMIALFLILPALILAVLHAACLRLQLSATDYLLLAIEKTLSFTIAAAWALVVSVFTRRVGAMVLVSIAVGAIGALLVSFPYSGRMSYKPTLEASHLQASHLLVAQTFLIVGAILIAMSWALRRRLWITATVLVVSIGFLASIHKVWKWNFVEVLSKESAMEKIAFGNTAIAWLDGPRLVSNRSEESIRYSQLKRSGRVTGLKDGWVGKLVKFQSTARFADGTVWTSEGGSEYHPFDDLTPGILPRLGIALPKNHPMQRYLKFQAWTLFECEKRLLEKQSNRRASVAGIGTFQVYQPCILGEMPTISGSSAVNGRFRYRLDRISALENQISFGISIRGVALNSRGDNNRGFEDVEFFLINPKTGKFANTSGSGGFNRVSGDWITIRKSVGFDPQMETSSQEEIEAFLEGARLYVIGTRYGGNITLPYEIPEMLLEERSDHPESPPP